MPLGSSSKIILAFVTLIIGVMLLSSVATEEQNKTTRTAVADEAFDLSSARIYTANNINESATAANKTVANAPSGWQASDTANSCNQIQNVVFSNASTDFVLNTDYEVDATSGIIHVLNTTDTINSPNSTFIDYTYCANDYLTASWQRSTLDLVPGFFAIALLLVSVGLFFSIAKDYGIV